MIAVRLHDIKLTNSGGDGHQGNAKPAQAAIYLTFRRDAKRGTLTPKIVHVFFIFSRFLNYVYKKSVSAVKKNSRLILTSNEQEKLIVRSRTPV